MGMLRPAAAIVLYSAWVPYRLVQAVHAGPLDLRLAESHLRSAIETSGK